MLTRISAPVLAALVLTSCAHHPPLRYVEVDVYHHGARSLYPIDTANPYAVRRAYYGDEYFSSLENTQMRRRMETTGVMYGNGCYRQWCER